MSYVERATAVMESADGTGTTRLLVYGTLLSGQPNSWWLRDARFVGPARTERGFRLHDLGVYPGLVAGGDTSVAGELYEVDAHTLAALDAFEGDEYHREHITLDDGQCAEAYLLAREIAAGFPLIASGDWRAHRQNAQRLTSR
ncbi:gamma-glutamylcyclotransferase [Pendulispora brunnea]|uniref:Gamma-glutamylcyclotransferase family protein n=1 Tax=Pendulispora brunnea TaxID=2905690 RepID=A0ABZ2JV31_9BACT